jgi:ribonuclease BN (tRNA processing enzyme)
MKLRFPGTGDAFGSGGRFNTCFYVEHRDGAFLIDCGASSMIPMRKFGIEPNSIQLIFITHLHGDHFGGLPFLILDAQLVSRRATSLTVAGPPGLCDRLFAAMEVLFPGSSRIERQFAIDILELEPEKAQDVLGITVTPYIVKHPSGAPPFALRIEADNKVLCYSGDTEWVDALLPSARNSDLLLIEAYFFEKPVKFHLDFATLAAKLPQIGAKRVILTHMSTEMFRRARETGYEIAEDGETVTV